MFDTNFTLILLLMPYMLSHFISHVPLPRSMGLGYVCKFISFRCHARRMWKKNRKLKKFIQKTSFELFYFQTKRNLFLLLLPPVDSLALSTVSYFIVLNIIILVSMRCVCVGVCVCEYILF